MSYQLNLTNGTILTDLIDGQIDSYSTDLTLVGRSYVGYGEILNENLIHLLENFSNVSPPENAIRGQLWWNSTDSQLEAYDGEQWRSVGRPYVQGSEPDLISGDIWFDTSRNQLFVNDGNQTNLIGPIYSSGQGVSGFVVETVVDSGGDDQLITSIYSSGTRIGVVSNVNFVPSPVSDIANYSEIREGVTLDQNYHLWGTVEDANRLQGLSSSDFVKTSEDGTIFGSLWLSDNDGVFVGTDKSFNARIDGPMTIGTSLNSSVQRDFRIVLSTDPSGGNIVDAIRITESDEHVGIFTTTPEDTLDVNGGTILRGGVRVTSLGDSTSSRAIFDVDVLQTAALNVDIGLISPLSTGDPSGDDLPLSYNAGEPAGIVIHVADSAGDDDPRTLQWTSNGDWWQTNTDFNLPSGCSYRINGTEVITENGVSVIDGSSLESVGPFTVGSDPQIGNNLLTTTDSDVATIHSPSGIVIDALSYDSSSDSPVILKGSEIDVTGSKITNLSNPEDPNDAATRGYVDTLYNLSPIVFSLDVTGYMYDDNGVKIGGVDEALAVHTRAYLHQMITPSSEMLNHKAKVVLFWYESPDITSVSREYYDSETDDSTAIFEYELTSLNFTTSGNFSLKRGLVVYTFQVGLDNGGYSWIWLDTESGTPEI